MDYCYMVRINGQEYLIRSLINALMFARQESGPTDSGLVYTRGEDGSWEAVRRWENW